MPLVAIKFTTYHLLFYKFIVSPYYLIMLMFDKEQYYFGVVVLICGHIKMIKVFNNFNTKSIFPYIFKLYLYFT